MQPQCLPLDHRTKRHLLACHNLRILPNPMCFVLTNAADSDTRTILLQFDFNRIGDFA